jgi:hypothetical protein
MTPWSILMMDTRLLNLNGVRPLDIGSMVPKSTAIL